MKEVWISCDDIYSPVKPLTRNFQEFDLAMAEVDGIENLVMSRNFLERSLANSGALASALDNNGQRFKVINRRLSSLEAEIRPIPTQKSTFVAIRDHVDRALGPAVAVIKVYDTIQELEKILLSDPCSDLSACLLMVKQLEEALKFLADNCGLAIQWLEGILQFLEDNAVADDLYAVNVKKSLRILKELQVMEERARQSGGLLCAAFEKLETGFNQLLAQNTVPVALEFFSSSVNGHQTCIAPSPLPVAVIQKLQAVVVRLNADNRLEKCISAYVEVRSLNARRSIQALDLNYLEMSITESDDVQDIEGYIDKWCKHLELAVKHVFEAEYMLSNDVFEKIGSSVWKGCFAKVAIQSGILSFLHFGKKLTECKNDPIKLLKLLDIFAALDNLRVDFNRLFGGEACVEIQTQTRDLIKRVVNSTCEIFFELPVQVGLQRQNPPPSDGSIPRLVRFVSDYCNQLLGDNYRPLLTQVLVINQSWKQEKYQEKFLTNQIVCIFKEIGLNLDSWAKVHKDISLSYIFMMNNHCHFCDLRGTKLGDLMGDSWLKAHEQYKDYYMTLYLRDSWGKIFAILGQEGPIQTSTTRNSSNDSIKKRLKAFNKAFNIVYTKQSNWVVANENLRLKMCKLVVQDFAPAYRNYLQNNAHFSAKPESSPGRYVKYTAQGLEAMLSSLFQPTLRKCSSSKHTEFIAKIRNVVTNNFRTTLMAI